MWQYQMSRLISALEKKGPKQSGWMNFLNLNSGGNSVLVYMVNTGKLNIDDNQGIEHKDHLQQNNNKSLTTQHDDSWLVVPLWGMLGN